MPFPPAPFAPDAWTNPEMLAQTSRMVGLLASEAGLQSAVAYLLSCLRGVLPVDQILCTIGEAGKNLIELARVTAEFDSLAFTPDGSRTRFAKREIMLPDSLEPAYLLERNPERGELEVRLRVARFSSLMTLPVDRIDNGPVLHVSLMSLRERAFTADDVRACLWVTRDLRALMAGLFAFPRGLVTVRRYGPQENAVELLRMCRGLSGVLRLVEKVAPLDATVLITGETGVGKEMAAEAVHRLSPRCDGPFLKLNCGAIPETLIDSTLFGHEKGAFTGAVGTQLGYFEQAEGGTLFLDEVGELSPLAQAKLLRVLDRREIQRVGSARGIPVDVRVVAATNRDLAVMVEKEKFREDLLFRLNVFPIVLPPLRERRMDISLLVHRFLEVKSKALGLETLPNIDKEEMSRLYLYNWPGNVRELEHKMDQALILARTGSGARPLTFDLPAGPHRRDLDTMASCEPPLTLQELERLYILRMLDRTGGVLNGENGAAKLLGLHPNTLRSRMKLLGIPLRGARGRRPKHIPPEV